MENKLFFAKDYQIKSNQTFFFDNNIWMLLYCPISDSKAEKQKTISKLYENILTYKNSIAINSLILSEFSNTYLRLDFKLWKEERMLYKADFKRDYFSSERSKETRETIISTIQNKILKISDRYPDSFNNLNFNTIFSYYKEMDYNDSIIYNECKRNNWILVSDDQDFGIIQDNVIIIRP